MLTIQDIGINHAYALVGEIFLLPSSMRSREERARGSYTEGELQKEGESRSQSRKGRSSKGELQ